MLCFDVGSIITNRLFNIKISSMHLHNFSLSMHYDSTLQKDHDISSLIFTHEVYSFYYPFFFFVVCIS